MDRVAIARAERRRQVTDELEVERDRAGALLEERDRIILELDGAGIDEQVFARMPPEDVELIRGALQGGPVVEREGLEEEWLELTGDEAEGDDEGWAAELREGNEAEIVRLEEEMVLSRRRQGALRRYLDALDDAAPGAESTIAELEAAWAAAGAAPRSNGAVRLICVRAAESVHETPERAEITVEDGLAGDRWATGKRDPDAQITLMDVRVAEVVAQDGTALDAPGDNFLVDLDLSEEALPVGTRVRLGEALLEVSPAPHTGCKKFRERFGIEALKWVNDNRDRRLRGVNCRVIEPGAVAVGDPITIV